MSDREVIRCGICQLNQFMTASKKCRRCDKILARPKLSILFPRTVHLSDEIHQLIRTNVDFYMKCWDVGTTTVAARGGVSRNYIWKILANRCKGEVQAHEKIAEGLGIPVGWLWTPPTLERVAHIFSMRCLLAARGLDLKLVKKVVEKRLSEITLRRAG